MVTSVVPSAVKMLIERDVKTCGGGVSVGAPTRSTGLNGPTLTCPVRFPDECTGAVVGDANGAGTGVGIMNGVGVRIGVAIRTEGGGLLCAQAVARKRRIANARITIRLIVTLFGRCIAP